MADRASRDEVLAGLVFWAVFGPMFSWSPEEWDHIRRGVPRRVRRVVRRAVRRRLRSKVFESEIKAAIIREETRP